MVFGFMDAYSIGGKHSLSRPETRIKFVTCIFSSANDVANSFATSVGSRSLTLFQAVCIAIFTEFGGAIALGAETASTIKDGIIKSALFNSRPDLLMAGFMCALIGSSTWVMYATYMGWPVSTTHSIIGALIGVGISGFGVDAVNWGWDGKGVAQIVTSWFLSPLVAGLLATIIYLLTRELVLKASNSLRRGIMAIPIYFTITTFIVTFYICIKNGRSTLKIEPKDGVVGNPLTITGDTTLAFSIIGGVTGFVLVFCYAFVVPYFVRRLEKEEKLKWYHLFYIHFVPPQPHDENIDLWLKRTLTPHVLEEQLENVELVVEKTQKNGVETDHTAAASSAPEPEPNAVGKVFRKLKALVFNSVFMDVASVQHDSNAAETHKVAVLFDNKTEFLYSFLQVMTACFASFGHGSNDVANALGPTAGVYEIWSKGSASSKAEIPKWLMAYCAFGIDAGLALYGYNIMKSLGNNLTYHSPSRGFSMELGAALSVVSASFLGLPVSTTQCIVGATVCVGLCNGSVKAVNWRMFGVSAFSWLLTLPVAGVLAGCLFALLTRGPSFSGTPGV
ncbi:Na+/Pi symporter [Phlyctochytrium bullatum]|nr:Na+/Pi symporter [Phlyctochytrium bullatum]